MGRARNGRGGIGTGQDVDKFGRPLPASDRDASAGVYDSLPALAGFGVEAGPNTGYAEDERGHAEDPNPNKRNATKVRVVRKAQKKRAQRREFQVENDDE